MRKLFLLLCLTIFMHSTVYATQGEVYDILWYTLISRKWLLKLNRGPSFFDISIVLIIIMIY